MLCTTHRQPSKSALTTSLTGLGGLAHHHHQQQQLQEQQQQQSSNLYHNSAPEGEEIAMADDRVYTVLADLISYKDDLLECVAIDLTKLRSVQEYDGLKK